MDRDTDKDRERVKEKRCKEMIFIIRKVRKASNKKSLEGWIREKLRKEDIKVINNR